MTFAPIAVVGQGCILPGAASPEALFQEAIEGRSALRSAPPGRLRMSRLHALAPGETAPEKLTDRCSTDLGGYVEGFGEVFDPAGFAIAPDEVRALGPEVQWVLYAARQALGGRDPSSLRRAGLILGNLSFPTAAMSRYAEQVWLDAQGPSFARGAARALAGVDTTDPRARFMSGLPALLAKQALGLGGEAFALDAACASSLYAIKLACDRLHDRSADLVLAGAVNAADPLFLHIGFTALSALSPSGQSRPFHRDADGLLPAEGAAIVALKRLADARRDGDAILGVIRGVGLSNDGRGRGLLAPAEEGQIRAMQQAYAAAGLHPSDVSLIECHATGTQVGDVTEIRSMSAVFAGRTDIPIGSLKGNLGHLITAAGAAGLIKVLGALRAGRRPPTLHADAPLPALAGSPFRLLAEPEPWPADRPRVAAVSAFGFGGNNAHLLVSDDDPRLVESLEVKPSRPAIAVVGLGAMLGEATGAEAAARALCEAAPAGPARREVSVALDGLRFPPRDLAETLPQQLLVLEAAREATAGITLPRERSSVLVGMGADPEVARYGARFRTADWAERWSAAEGGVAPAAWIEAVRDAIVPRLDAASVVGTMPNIPANRLNSQLDLGGPSFSISAEQASGLVALGLAARALAAGEIDAAVVGAVDLSSEPVHRAALAAIDPRAQPDRAGDAAVVLTLKRLDDARRDGDRVLALLDDAGREGALVLGDGEGAIDPSPNNLPHAAAGLLHVAAAIACAAHGARPSPGRGAVPWMGPRIAETRTRVLGGTEAHAFVSAVDPPRALLFEPAPRVHVFGGRDRAEVRRVLAEGRPSSGGPARLAIVAASDAELAQRRDLALRALDRGDVLPEGLFYGDAPLGGDLAFVFTGAAASYQGMGRELALALPDPLARLERRFPSLPKATSWIFGPPGPASHPLDQLWSSAFLCQLHAEISLGLLGLTPQATIGYSSGESNALFALGVWRDLDAMATESWRAPMFTTDLVGDFTAIRRAFRKLGADGPWKAYSVAAPVAEVREALRGEPSAHLTIVNTVDDVVIGGEASACARVIDRLGRARALPLAYEMAAHCPEIEEIHRAWYDLHRRETTPVAGLRHYSAGSARSFSASADAIAAAITAQALSTLDFPRMIEQAYADGVRVFLEHGPRGLCSGWIKRILGDRPHLAVPLDVAGRSGVRQLANAAAALVANGLDLPLDELHRALAAGAAPARPAGPALTVAAHRAPVVLPALSSAAQVMPPAPALAPVIEPASIAEPAPPVVVPAAPTAVPSSPALSSSAPAEILGRAAAQMTRMGEIHRAFLEGQSAAHAQFLAMQQRMQAGLLAAAAGRATPRSRCRSRRRARRWSLHRSHRLSRRALS
ncbi:MAG: beta-ketoacyl synthase N-terminal-like domain-containing protein [Byssovorax sp.]